MVKGGGGDGQGGTMVKGDEDELQILKSHKKYPLTLLVPFSTLFRNKHPVLLSLARVAG